MMTVRGLAIAQLILGLMAGVFIFGALAIQMVNDPLWIQITMPLGGIGAAAVGIRTCLSPPSLACAKCSDTTTDNGH